MAYNMRTNAYGYQHGTEAPRVDPERIREAKREYVKSAGDRVEERVREMKRVRTGMNGVQVIVVTLCLLAMLAVAGMYILSVSRNETIKNSVETLKKNVQELNLSNAKIRDSIEARVDYDEVYAFAIEQGMQIPDKQQIVRYSYHAAEYVSKNAEIPNE